MREIGATQKVDAVRWVAPFEMSGTLLGYETIWHPTNVGQPVEGTQSHRSLAINFREWYHSSVRETYVG